MNAKCKMIVSASPMILNSCPKGIPQFCILHFEFCIKKGLVAKGRSNEPNTFKPYPGIYINVLSIYSLREFDIFPLWEIRYVCFANSICYKSPSHRSVYRMLCIYRPPKADIENTRRGFISRGCCKMTFCSSPLFMPLPAGGDSPHLPCGQGTRRWWACPCPG